MADAVVVTVGLSGEKRDGLESAAKLRNVQLRQVDDLAALKAVAARWKAVAYLVGVSSIAMEVVDWIPSSGNGEPVPVVLVVEPGVWAAWDTMRHVELARQGVRQSVLFHSDDVNWLQVLDDVVRADSESSPRVLVVDDDPEFADTAAAILGGQGMVVKVTYDSTAALETIFDFDPHVIVLDQIMPSVTGTELTRAIRRVPAAANIPIILATVSNDLDQRLAAFEAGVDDFIIKPIIPAELVSRVQSKLARAFEVAHRAERDPLTGALNRRSFVERAGGVLLVEMRRNTSVSLVLVDLDHLKRINDQFGHSVGDSELVEVARHLVKAVRRGDLVGRWGGDEFILCLPGAIGPNAAALIQRVLERHVPATEAVAKVSFAAGIATAPTDGTSLSQLIETADGRLYQGKSNGGDQIVHS